MLGLNLGLSLTSTRGAQAAESAPTTPGTPTAGYVSNTRIDLSWTASTDDVGVDHYTVYRATDGGAYSSIGTSASNSYSDTTVTLTAHSYIYKVSASDAAANESGQSAASNALGPNDVIVALGPIAWWKIDEGAGTTLADSSGNSHPITVGSGTWVTGGYTFSTTVRGPVHALGISGAQARTVIFAAKPAAADPYFGCGWIGDGVTTNGTRWTFRNTNTATSLRIENSGAGDSMSTLNLTPDTWGFFAIKQSGANLNTGKIYINGDSEAVDASSVCNTAGNFVINANGTNPAGTAGGVPFTAGPCIVFASALSDANIAAVRTALTTIMAARGITLP